MKIIFVVTLALALISPTSVIADDDLDIVTVAAGCTVASTLADRVDDATWWLNLTTADEVLKVWGEYKQLHAMSTTYEQLIIQSKFVQLARACAEARAEVE